MSTTRERRRSTHGMRRTIVASAMVIGACALTSAFAQQPGTSTWRCGNSYSDRPCAGGTTVKVDDARSDDDRQAADEATRRNAKLADRLERTRLSEEKQAHQRDQRAAQDAQRAALAQRRLEAQERLEKARATKLAAEPRKATASYGERPGSKPGEEGGAKKKRRKPAASDAS